MFRYSFCRIRQGDILFRWVVCVDAMVRPGILHILLNIVRGWRRCNIFDIQTKSNF